jgi:hypothetical protein
MLYTGIFMSFKEYFHLGVIGFSSNIFLTIADMYAFVVKLMSISRLEHALIVLPWPFE